MYALNMRNIECFFEEGDKLSMISCPFSRYEWDPARPGLSVAAASAVQSAGNFSSLNPLHRDFLTGLKRKCFF